MQQLCTNLADTGANMWLIVGIALSLLVGGCTYLFLIRKGKSTYKNAGFFVIVLLFASLLLIGTPNVRAESVDCSPAIPAGSTRGAPNPTGSLVLVDNTYTANDLAPFADEFGGWSLDILANDHAPAGDPIDPSTVRLTGPATHYRDIGSDYDAPAGTNFDILNPANPNGPTWGFIATDGDYDGDTYIQNGKVYVYLEDSVPPGTVFTIQYTAKTMSGIDASNTATITITKPIPPSPPELVDDTYTLGSSGGAILPVLSNDQPDPGDPLNIATLELANPNIEAGGYGTDWYASDGSSANPGDPTAIHWQVVGGKVVVTFGDDVPLDTSISIPYRITSQGGLEPPQDGIITVTRSSTEPTPITVTAADFDPCLVDLADGATLNLLSYSTTTIGSLDPSTVDLDPLTTGRQTTYLGDGYNLSVDSSGIVTYHKTGPVSEVSVYYTISNTNGDVSGINSIMAPNSCNT